MPFTPARRNIPDEERFFPGTFVLVLVFEGKRSLLRAKPAYLVGHLPAEAARNLLESSELAANR
jgi:hypothetical protein